MDALLQSFVRKVHTHALASPNDVATPDSIQHLLSVLSRPHVTPEAATSVLGAIHSGIQYDNYGFLSCQGVDALLRFVIEQPYLTFDVCHGLANIIHLIPHHHLIEAIVRVDLQRVVPRLLDVYHPLGDAYANEFLLVTKKLLVDASTREVLLACNNPLVRVLTMLTSAILDRADSSFLAASVLIRMIRTTQDAQQFWRLGGKFLLQAMVRHQRTHHDNQGAGLLLMVSTLSRFDEELLLQSFDLTADVARMMVEEVDGETNVHSFADLMNLPRVGTCIASFPEVLPSLMVMIVQRLDDRVPDHSLGAAIALIHVLLPKDRTATSHLVHLKLMTLFESVNSPDRRYEASVQTRASIAVAVCQALRTEFVVRIFPRLMSLLTDATNDSWPTLDAEMAFHVEEMVSDPSSVVVPLRLYGFTGPVLFHTMAMVVGRTMNTSHPSGTVTRLVEYMEGHVTQLLQESPRAPGMARYCRDLIQGYNLSVAPPTTRIREEEMRCFSTCPVTMELVHCPVTASDGHTYELQALLEVHRMRPMARSPLTREPLELWAVYNRQLVVTEVAVMNALRVPTPCRVSKPAETSRRRRIVVDRRSLS